MHGGSDAGSSVVRSAVNWLGGVGSMVVRVGVVGPVQPCSLGGWRRQDSLCYSQLDWSSSCIS